MEIGAISSALSAVTSSSAGTLAEAVGVKMLDNSMEASEAMSAQLITLMEQSVTPHLGGSIDLRI